MIGQHTATTSFDVRVRLEDRGDRWAAYIEPPALTVYGATESEVMARVDEGLEFFKQYFQDDPDGVRKLRQYLDSHGVPNVVTESAPTRPMRFRRPVTFLMEAAASA